MTKKEVLMANGTFNKTHEKVKSKKFLKGSFYDPMDIVQVKYEMLKEAEEGSQNIVQVAHEFGFSRASFYNIKKEFDKQGLSAFVGEKTGPKRAYKLTNACRDYIDRYVFEKPKASSNDITENLKKEVGINITKRTVERYRSKKKHQ